MKSRSCVMKYVKPLNLLSDVAKKKMSFRGRLLGLDVGDRYVGLALSDRSNTIAFPLSVLMRTNKNIDLMATDFKNLITKVPVLGLVVGYPFKRVSSEEDFGVVNVFIEELKKTGKLKDVKYTYWDERLSSKTVELMVKPLNLHPVREKTSIDKLAAVTILQEYLDYANKNIISDEVLE